MIVIDTSALFAILAVEPEANALKAQAALHSRVAMATPTWVEAAIVCSSRLVDGRERFDDAVRLLRIERHVFDGAQADIAVDAFARFGRGSGHPARLNYGDCFSYALARSLDVPLLFKGGDFVHTDVRSALASPP